MSEIKLFNRWTIKKKTFWFILAGISIPLILIFFLVAFLFTGSFSLGANGNNMAYDSYGYAEESMVMGAPAIDGYYGEDEMVLEKMIVESELMDSDFRQTEPNPSTNHLASLTERIIIKNGNISIEVEDTRDSREEIQNIVKALENQGAFIINSFESQNYEGDVPYISMSIRVPFESFDMVMDAIANMGLEINNRNETSDDVTSEYVDLGNRIESMEAARDRLLEIMLNADTTEDLLFAEQKLTEREANLESLKGRLKYLSEAAQLSQISISLAPHIYSQPIDYSWKPANTLRNAYSDLIDSLESFADFLIVFAVLFLPWVLLFAFIVWVVRGFYKRRTAKKIIKNDEKSE